MLQQKQQRLETPIAFLARCLCFLVSKGIVCRGRRGYVSDGDEFVVFALHFEKCCKDAFAVIFSGESAGPFVPLTGTQAIPAIGSIGV